MVAFFGFNLCFKAMWEDRSFVVNTAKLEHTSRYKFAVGRVKSRYRLTVVRALHKIDQQGPVRYKLCCERDDKRMELKPCGAEAVDKSYQSADGDNDEKYEKDRQSGKRWEHFVRVSARLEQRRRNARGNSHDASCREVCSREDYASRDAERYREIGGGKGNDVYYRGEREKSGVVYLNAHDGRDKQYIQKIIY